MAGSMASHHLPAATPTLSNLSLSIQHGHTNTPIDLTGDDDDDDIDQYIIPPLPKRIRVDNHQSRNGSGSTTFASRPPSASSSTSSSVASTPTGNPHNMHPSPFTNPRSQHTLPTPEAYRPPFAGPSNSAAFFPQKTPRAPAPMHHQPSVYHSPPKSSSGNFIDLTRSPSPPLQSQYTFQNGDHLPPDLDARTAICIGQLSATALVLYPVPYIVQEPGATEPSWVPVRLQYEHNPSKIEGSETIHIKVPSNVPGTGVCDSFGVVEQKVATNLGGLLGKGLIRIEAKVRKGPPNLPILPLEMIVFTPKGNIHVVGPFMYQNHLLLDHPTPPYDLQKYGPLYYLNPHNPPPGGHSKVLHASNRLFSSNNASRWTTSQVSAKSVEVQRSQVDEVFKSIKGGDQLPETEAAPEIATPLYPHQKKALTFLLEREQEKPDQDGDFSSLWRRHKNRLNGQDFWVHAVTERETFKEPQEAKGAILADDMGLGKTITCVSLIAATLTTAKDFASTPIEQVDAVDISDQDSEMPDPAAFMGSVWGMPNPAAASSSKAKAKMQRLQDKMASEQVRASRIKTKSRATLIICPLSTVANWEDQLKDHWKGEVFVVGGAGGTSSACSSSTPSTSGAQCTSTPGSSTSQPMALLGDVKLNKKFGRAREGKPFRVYIYHGNARRPDPTFLADFDAVITTYATLASEYSKQSRSIANAEAEDEEEESEADGIGGVDVDANGNEILRLPKPKKGTKRKKPTVLHSNEATSALQSIHWFRVVLDEAHCIKETGTVASRACCDLVADRRLCLTGTPVQNKLDDVYALIKFLRLSPLDDKNVWTQWIGSPVKFAQPIGVARLQMVMKCITLRRTKESTTEDGKRILSLPPRRDELRYLKFDSQEQSIYNQFFNESKAEFTEMSDKNEVMKNYVGILQKILRLRQICDHFELVEGKELTSEGQTLPSMQETVAAIQKDGLTPVLAQVIFGFLREAGMTQCVECSAELSSVGESQGEDDVPSAPKRPKKSKNPSSRAPTRANSPTLPKAILTRCQHLFCISCYRQCVHPGWPEVVPPSADSACYCPACQTPLQYSDALEVKADLLEGPKKKPAKREKRQRGQSLPFNPSTKVRALMEDLIQFSKANPYSANYDPESIDIQMTDEKGNRLDDGVVKTVVFSQWTSMLDKVEDALEAAGIRYDRLDGTMKRDDRSRAMDALKHEPDCEVLLVSLKAGGVGLNLTAAQRVYLMDPYWNPAVENQAVDRIHRLGQTRPVTTVKLIIENSIEDRLLAVQKKKTALANMTLGQTLSKADMTARRLEELQELFKD
ncbi:SNF2 family N-terminal domain-containing protein [Lentinula raphanica]|uniref:SNF2 family N-terminal domain-containing protein n=1 Tax=Lentinula raphanica TaxID=153919 RepID=A0AA38UF61_9AGAR|nr:SNF2 family N-terminal domain-containing protein [Lentinula raphanica]KAJ3968759.1 SNF2 family N-terminal domain-containing protein [Lentinula raphanica]